MSCKEIFLEDFICELVDDENRLNKFNVYFKRWIGNFKTLQNLTKKIPLYGSVEILITDKHRFLNELYNLYDKKLIKSSIFQRLV
ncbi:MAG: hypothetical protein GX568_05105 [Candidatus Gastranaerophilales bacterium]|nr:hypothetical protein [Candidatus Gastranaerophilales bacterium]